VHAGPRRAYRAVRAGVSGTAGAPLRSAGHAVHSPVHRAAANAGPAIVSRRADVAGSPAAALAAGRASALARAAVDRL
jgi:hypothetical protein